MYLCMYGIFPLPQTEGAEAQAAASKSSTAPQQVAYFFPSTGWQLLSK